MSLLDWLLPAIAVTITFIIILNLQSGTYDDDCCSICGSYYAYSDLEDGKDITWDYCGGLGIALSELWDEYNNGKGLKRTDGHITYLSMIQSKFYPKSKLNWSLINLSNPCPVSPNKKYIGMGNVVEYIPWSYDGPAYSICRVNISGKVWTFSNCGSNYSYPVYVFRYKGGAWWNQCKNAKFYSVGDYPSIVDDVEQEWQDWERLYYFYLKYGGVDVGDQY